jgi:molybdate transport system substrate-binding protein
MGWMSAAISGAGSSKMIQHAATPAAVFGDEMEQSGAPRNKDAIMNISSVRASMLGLAMALAPMTGAQAAELKVIAGGTMTASLQDLGPRFEKATGHKVVSVFDSTPNLIKMATSGAPFDLGVVPVDVMKDAAASGRFASGPTIDIARVGYGVAFRAGAPKPYVGTPEALKETLLKAQSVAFIPESAAGAYVLSVFQRLGIGDTMKAKTKPQTTTGAIPQAVAKGDAELGVFTMNVLIAPGVEIAGPFPAELQQDLVFTAAVAANSKEAQAAKAFIDYLKSAEAIAVMKAKGLTPG